MSKINQEKYATKILEILNGLSNYNINKVLESVKNTVDTLTILKFPQSEEEVQL